MVASSLLTESEKANAAKRISHWLDIESNQKSAQSLREFIEEYFPGCESLYISLREGDVMENTELGDKKIPRFVVDIVGIELFEGKHGKKIRKMLLEGVYAKDYELLRRFWNETGDRNWDAEYARIIMNRLVGKKWIPGGGWTRQFVRVLGFSVKFSGIASPQKPENMESVEKRVHLNPLENFQENIKSQILEVLKKNNSSENRCILWLPTGAGKTRTAAEAMIAWWKTRPSSARWIVWIAHTEELCEQALQCFRQLWEESGDEGTTLNIHRVWGGRGMPDPNDEGIIVAGIDQLYSMIPKKGGEELEDEVGRIREDVGLVIVDEAHRSFAPSYTRVLGSLGLTRYPDNSSQVPFVGLTATPFRTSEDETRSLLRKFCDNILWPNPAFAPGDSFSDKWRDWGFVIDRLTEEKVLSRPQFHYLETSSKFEMDERETRFLEEKNLLPPKLLERVGSNTKRNLEVFRSIKEWADRGRIILFFGANLNQAVMMSKFLNENGIKSAVITGETRYGTRQRYVRMFRENRIQVLCNYQVLTTGFDAPKIDTIIIARPTGSRSLYEQMIGRGLRGTKFGGTDECDIVTVIDNILNHERRRIKLGYEEYAESAKAITDSELKKIHDITDRFSPTGNARCVEPSIPRPGAVFTEKQLHEKFMVPTSGGIRFTNRHNTVLLIDSNAGTYENLADKGAGTVVYTGTGQGDQGFASGIGKFNARVRDSANYTVLYFHKPERNRIVFKYPVRFESFYYESEKNQLGRQMRVIKFRLRIILAQCPSCNKIASTGEEIDEMFGFRRSNGKRIRQSWCRECRGP